MAGGNQNPRVNNYSVCLDDRVSGVLGVAGCYQWETNDFAKHTAKYFLMIMQYWLITVCNVGQLRTRNNQSPFIVSKQATLAATYCHLSKHVIYELRKLFVGKLMLFIAAHTHITRSKHDITYQSLIPELSMPWTHTTPQFPRTQKWWTHLGYEGTKVVLFAGCISTGPGGWFYRERCWP